MSAVDLQSHSRHSDGELEAGAVVAAAAPPASRCSRSATTTPWTASRRRSAPPREHGLALLPATEISAVDAGYEDLHVLGYGIDHPTTCCSSA